MFGITFHDDASPWYWFQVWRKNASKKIRNIQRNEQKTRKCSMFKLTRMWRRAGCLLSADCGCTAGRCEYHGPCNGVYSFIYFRCWILRRTFRFVTFLFAAHYYGYMGDAVASTYTKCRHSQNASESLNSFSLIADGYREACLMLQFHEWNVICILDVSGARFQQRNQLLNHKILHDIDARK